MSVAFNDAKRARAKAALRAKEEREKRDPMGLRAPRVDRSKYPSFKKPGWTRRRRTRAAARADARLRGRRACCEREAARGGVRGQGARRERRAERAGRAEAIVEDDVAGDARTSVPTSPDPAPALNRFIALTEAFADASSGASASALSAEDRRRR